MHLTEFQSLTYMCQNPKAFQLPLLYKFMQGTFSLCVSTANFSDSHVGLGIILFLLKGYIVFFFFKQVKFL